MRVLVAYATIILPPILPVGPVFPRLAMPAGFRLITGMHKINLAEKFSLFTERWSPKIVAELNGQHVKLVRSLGVFPWHHHEHEDELFLVVSGTLQMEFRGRTVVLQPGELIVVPRGIEHRPIAAAEVCLLLFEPASTVNTGSAGGAHTVAQPGWI